MTSLKEEIKQEVASKVREKAVYPSNWANPNIHLNKSRFETMYPTRPKSYIATSTGYESLVEDDYFDGYIREQQTLFGREEQKKEAVRAKVNMDEDEENILARLGVSSNHDTIMDIVGNNTDLITDTEYQILDEALCQLTLDELAYISNCKDVKDADKYIKSVTYDYFTDSEITELHTICKHYARNINFLTGGAI